MLLSVPLAASLCVVLDVVVVLLCPQILTALGVITRQGGYLISTAQGASQATANPVAKNHFAEAAKSILGQTEAVVRGVKAAVKPDGG